MITLTIHLPDNNSEVISTISSLVTNAGGDIYMHSDDDLNTYEFKSLKRGYKEALLIKDSKLKGIPYSELWND